MCVVGNLEDWDLGTLALEIFGREKSEKPPLPILQGPKSFEHQLHARPDTETQRLLFL